VKPLKAGQLVKSLKEFTVWGTRITIGMLGVVYKKDSGKTGLYTHVVFFTNGAFGYVNSSMVEQVKKSDCEVRGGKLAYRETDRDQEV
jgi:hypothetical protein